MAKRTRASRSTHRPGGQGPSRAKKPAETEEGPEASADLPVSDAEEIGASYPDVEVDEVAAAAVAAATTTTTTAEPVEQPAPGRRARRRARGRTSAKSGRGDLATRAAVEDVWVREDLRRIGVVSLVLVGGLVLAYVLFGMLDILGLY